MAPVRWGILSTADINRKLLAVDVGRGEDAPANGGHQDASFRINARDRKSVV